MTFLERIMKEKKERVRGLREKIPLEEVRMMAEEEAKSKEKKPFFETFAGPSSDRIRIIAEVKKASPSMGMLVVDLDVSGLAADYERGGAAALSVITEERHFHGSLAYIAAVKKSAGLPVLRKDFIVDEYEVYESKAYGADAVLLIGEALGAGQLRDYLAIAEEIDIDVLLEVHSIGTYEKIAGLGRFLLGINNRDLETLKVDLCVARGLLEKLPGDRPVIVESGIEGRSDMVGFIAKGVSGFLIGTSLVLSKDPVAKLMELRGAGIPTQ